jgi:hypothetical protein
MRLRRSPGNGTLPTVRGALIALVTLTCFGVSNSPAFAGTMTLYSCHTPSGRTAGTAGWTVWANNAPTLLRSADDCAKGAAGTLIARIGGTGAMHSNEFIGWKLHPIQGTTVTSFSAWVCGRALTWDALVAVEWQPGGWTFVNTFDQPQFLGCAGAPPWWNSTANLVQRDGLAATEINVEATCYMGGCPEREGVVSDIQVAAFKATIRDDRAPTVSSVGGPLAANAAHTGDEGATFDVADTGVGVFRGVIEGRLHREGAWRELASSVISPLASCSPLRETMYLYEFDSPKPCSGSVERATITLDNSLLPEGLHELRVVVEDAAGNRADVLPARPYVVPSRSTTTVAGASPAPAASVDASRVAQLRITAPGRRRLVSAAPFRVSGRLLDPESRPIAGATVLIKTRPFLPKAGRSEGDWQILGEVLTDRDGTFRGRVPGGGSRSVLLTYASDAIAATTQADFVVPAQVTVRADRTRVRNGRSVILRGRVAGPIPPGGVLVAMEVREPGRWIPVATTRRWVRTRPSGTFALSYRFLRTFRASTYRFRVVADEDTAFQYGRGASRPVDIRVRP